MNNQANFSVGLCLILIFSTRYPGPAGLESRSCRWSVCDFSSFSRPGFQDQPVLGLVLVVRLDLWMGALLFLPFYVFSAHHDFSAELFDP